MDRVAEKLVRILQNEGFKVQSEDASFISYCAKGPEGALIIEDEAETEAFCLKLIRLGAQVQEVQD